MILDSGADLSVLPLSYGEVGTPLDKTSVLRDAQGRKMQGGKLRQALVVIRDDLCNTMCLRETFALSNVSCGWKIDEAGMDRWWRQCEAGLQGRVFQVPRLQTELFGHDD